MKKNFFKKLSFVIALAMIISVVAPAAGAFAASKVKLNATKKYLHLGVDGSDDFNFNVVSKKGTGWKYSWESSNDDVAVVNEKNGVVTAAGVGTAKVTVSIVDKDGEEVGEATATVVVRDNIKEVTIAGKPAGDKLGVGVANDFNRDFVTVSGSKKVTSSVTKWSVSPATGATIDAKGVFTATAAGEYTITAMSFQSTDKYDAYVKDPVANAAYLLDSDTYKFTVAASMTGAKQVDLDTVNVTFNAAMADVDKNIAVYQLVGETKVKQLVSKVEMDADKKVASVSLYIPFATGSTYTIEYTGMDAVSFKAATTKAEDVASMKVDTTTAVKNVEKPVAVKLFNAEGVDITTDTLLTRVTMKSAGEQGTFFNEATKKVLIFETGKTTQITATYHTYKYNTTTGAEEGNVTAVGIITGVDADPTNITGLNAWTIVASDASPNFSDVKQMLAADDYGKKLFVKLNNKTGNDTNSVDSEGADAGDFNYTSSDESVLIIDNAGNLYPVKEGVATVVVKYATGTATKVPVATIPITVSAKKAATNFTLDAYEFALSNSVGLHDSKDVKMTMKDQLGRAFAFTGYKIERLSAPLLADGKTMTDDNVIAPTTTGGASNSDGEVTLTFNGDSTVVANPIDKGVYVYKITAKDISRVVTVTVQEPNDDEVSYYRLSLSTTSKDMKVSSTTSYPQAVNIDLFGYTSNGVKLSKVTLANNPTFHVEVIAQQTDNDNPTGWKFGDNTDLETAGYDVVKKDNTVAGVTGSVIRKAPVGSWKVTAYEGTRAWDTVYFSTTDTQSGAVLSDIKSQTYSITLSQADIDNKTANLITAIGGADADNGLKFKVDGASVSIVAVDAVGTPDSIAVKSVTVRKLIKDDAIDANDVYLDYKVNVGLNMKKK